MNLWKDLFRRLLQSRRWIAAQFGLTLLLILIGIAWTRLPEKHLWQVALSLLLPLLVAIFTLGLQTETMRSFANDDGKRVRLHWGALSVLVWIGVAWLCWAVLDWCDDQIPQWAGYLNSQIPARRWTRTFTYEHIHLWMTYIEWVFRWIVVPAKVLPFAIASAQSGWRLPVRRLLQLLWNWRWWLGVTLVALVSVLLPGHFYSATPQGTVSAQLWHVSLKLAVSYILAVSGWVLLLAWAGALFGCQKPVRENDGLTELLDRLWTSRRWIAAQFGWVLLWIWVSLARLYLSSVLHWPKWFSNGLTATYSILIMILALVVQAGMMRISIVNHTKRVNLVWGALAMLLWSVLLIISDAVQDSLQSPFLNWALVWLVAPVIYIPFASVSSLWGLRLPWRRILRVLGVWRWWLAVLLTGAVGAFAEHYFDGLRAWPYVWDVNLPTGLKMGAIDMLEMGIWILLLGWFAALFNRTLPLVPDAQEEVSTSATAK